MSTLHRRDISSAELTLVAQFGHAVRKLLAAAEPPEIFQLLAPTAVWLPVWYHSNGGWVLSTHKQFPIVEVGDETNYIGIVKSDFRRLCKHVGAKDIQVCTALYRMSMLGVADPKGPLLFRQQFTGYRDWYEVQDPYIREGYLVERRRIYFSVKKEVRSSPDSLPER